MRIVGLVGIDENQVEFSDGIERGKAFKRGSDMDIDRIRQTGPIVISE